MEEANINLKQPYILKNQSDLPLSPNNAAQGKEGHQSTKNAKDAAIDPSSYIMRTAESDRKYSQFTMRLQQQATMASLSRDQSKIQDFRPSQIGAANLSTLKQTYALGRDLSPKRVESNIFLANRLKGGTSSHISLEPHNGQAAKMSQRQMDELILKTQISSQESAHNMQLNRFGSGSSAVSNNLGPMQFNNHITVFQQDQKSGAVTFNQQEQLQQLTSSVSSSSALLSAKQKITKALNAAKFTKETKKSAKITDIRKQIKTARDINYKPLTGLSKELNFLAKEMESVQYITMQSRVSSNQASNQLVTSHFSANMHTNQSEMQHRRSSSMIQLQSMLPLTHNTLFKDYQQLKGGATNYTRNLPLQSDKKSMQGFSMESQHLQVGSHPQNTSSHHHSPSAINRSLSEKIEQKQIKLRAQLIQNSLSSKLKIVSKFEKSELNHSKTLKEKKQKYRSQVQAEDKRIKIAKDRQRSTMEEYRRTHEEKDRHQRELMDQKQDFRETIIKSRSEYLKKKNDLALNLAKERYEINNMLESEAKKGKNMSTHRTMKANMLKDLHIKERQQRAQLKNQEVQIKTHLVIQNKASETEELKNKIVNERSQKDHRKQEYITKTLENDPSLYMWMQKGASGSRMRESMKDLRQRLFEEEAELKAGAMSTRNKPRGKADFNSEAEARVLDTADNLLAAMKRKTIVRMQLRKDFDGQVSSLNNSGIGSALGNQAGKFGQNQKSSNKEIQRSESFTNIKILINNEDAATQDTHKKVSATLNNSKQNSLLDSEANLNAKQLSMMRSMSKQSSFQKKSLKKVRIKEPKQEAAQTTRTASTARMDMKRLERIVDTDKYDFTNMGAQWDIINGYMGGDKMDKKISYERALALTQESRLLPFEVRKKERLFNLGQCFKLEKDTSDKDYENALRFLELRENNYTKEKALQLARKTSCRTQRVLPSRGSVSSFSKFGNFEQRGNDVDIQEKTDNIQLEVMNNLIELYAEKDQRLREEIKKQQMLTPKKKSSRSPQKDKRLSRPMTDSHLSLPSESVELNKSRSTQHFQFKEHFLQSTSQNQSPSRQNLLGVNPKATSTLNQSSRYLSPEHLKIPISSTFKAPQNQYVSSSQTPTRPQQIGMYILDKARREDQIIKQQETYKTVMWQLAKRSHSKAKRAYYEQALRESTDDPEKAEASGVRSHIRSHHISIEAINQEIQNQQMNSSKNRFQSERDLFRIKSPGAQSMPDDMALFPSKEGYIDMAQTARIGTHSRGTMGSLMMPIKEEIAQTERQDRSLESSVATINQSQLNMGTLGTSQLSARPNKKMSALDRLKLAKAEKERKKALQLQRSKEKGNESLQRLATTMGKLSRAQTTNGSPSDMRRASVTVGSTMMATDRNATTAANSSALNNKVGRHRKLASAAGSEIVPANLVPVIPTHRNLEKGKYTLEQLHNLEKIRHKQLQSEQIKTRLLQEKKERAASEAERKFEYIQTQIQNKSLQKLMASESKKKLIEDHLAQIRSLQKESNKQKMSENEEKRKKAHELMLQRAMLESEIKQQKLGNKLHKISQIEANKEMLVQEQRKLLEKLGMGLRKIMVNKKRQRETGFINGLGSRGKSKAQDNFDEEDYESEEYEDEAFVNDPEIGSRLYSGDEFDLEEAEDKRKEGKVHLHLNSNSHFELKSPTQ